MSSYRLGCQYCGHEWDVNNVPNKQPTCVKCKDRNLTIKDLAKDSIDYYAGSPPFEEKKKEVVLEEVSDPFADYRNNNFGYVPGRWD